MSAEEKKETNEEENKPDPLSSLVDSIKEHNEKLVKALHRPEEKPADTGPSWDDQVSAYNERVKAAKAKMKELMDDGKWDEGITVLEQAYQTAPKRQEDPSSNPLVKATAKQIERTVKSEFKELTESYGDEVEAEIKKLGPVDRLDEDKVRESIQRVQARHATDLVQAEVDRRVREELDKQRGLAPSNVPNPSLGESQDTELYELSFSERKAARDMGVPYKEWAAAKKQLEKGHEKGVPGVEIMSARELHKGQ